MEVHVPCPGRASCQQWPGLLVLARTPSPDSLPRCLSQTPTSEGPRDHPGALHAKVNFLVSRHLCPYQVPPTGAGGTLHPLPGQASCALPGPLQAGPRTDQLLSVYTFQHSAPSQADHLAPGILS